MCIAETLTIGVTVGRASESLHGISYPNDGDNHGKWETRRVGLGQRSERTWSDGSKERVNRRLASGWRRSTGAMTSS